MNVSDDQLPFSSRGVQLEVLSDALQHPATLYPAGAAGLAAIYGMLFGPFLGGSPAALGFAVASALVAGGSFCFHYFINGEAHARRKVQQFLAREEDRAREIMDQRRLQLQEGFASLESPAGRMALGQLVGEYTQLREALQRYAADDGVAIGRIAASAQATYREGLEVLASAFELLSATETGGAQALPGELAALEREIKKMRAAGAPPERVRVKEETVVSHRERMRVLDEQRVRAEELLKQSDSCEAALQRVRMQLPSLRADWTEEQADQASQSLLSIVESVRRVQERLGGEADRQQDEAYLRLGQTGRDRR